MAGLDRFRAGLTSARLGLRLRAGLALAFPFGVFVSADFVSRGVVSRGVVSGGFVFGGLMSGGAVVWVSDVFEGLGR